MWFRGGRPRVSQRRVSAPWCLQPLKAMTSIREKARKKILEWLKSCPPGWMFLGWGWRKGLGCVPLAWETQVAYVEHSPHTKQRLALTQAVMSLRFLYLCGRSQHLLLTDEESEIQEASRMRLINALMGVLPSLSGPWGSYIFIFWHKKKLFSVVSWPISIRGSLAVLPVWGEGKDEDQAASRREMPGSWGQAGQGSGDAVSQLWCGQQWCLPVSFTTGVLGMPYLFSC